MPAPPFHILWLRARFSCKPAPLFLRALSAAVVTDGWWQKTGIFFWGGVIITNLSEVQLYYIILSITNFLPFIHMVYHIIKVENKIGLPRFVPCKIMLNVPPIPSVLLGNCQIIY